MITAAAEVAHSLATTPEEHRRRKVNEALNKFDKALRKERGLSVSGYRWGTLAWAWKEEARLVGEELKRLRVTA